MRTPRRRIATDALALHAGRIALSLSLIAVACALDSFSLGALGGSLLLLAAFSFNHELVHRALGLPPRARAGLMLLAGSLMAMSGHAIEVSHRLHHARPLGRDDLEGKGARLPPLAALAAAPGISLALRLISYRTAKAPSRRWQRIETTVNIATFVALLTARHPSALGVAAALLLGQLTMPFWAGHVPHRAPARLTAIVRRLTRIAALGLSTTLLGLAYHDEHHRHPRLPCHRLKEVAHVD